MDSKYRIFGGVGLVLGLLAFILVILPFIFSKPYDSEQNDGLPISFFIFWLIIGTGFILFQILTRINKLAIEDGKLIYNNIFWRKTKEIDLHKIDGFQLKNELAIGGSHELITLLDNGNTLLKISSFYIQIMMRLKR